MFLNMNKKIKVSICVTLSVIALGGIFGVNKVVDYTNNEGEEIQKDLQQEEETVEYKTNERAQIAINRLTKEKKLAQLKQSASVSQKKVALVFTGLAMPEQMEKIIKLLEEYEYFA